MSTTQEIISSRNIDWITLVFIATYHLLLVILLPVYLWTTTPGWELIIGTFLFLTGSGLSITAGYHRLFSHRTYRAKKPVEWVLLFFGSMSAQGSVLRWAHDHRLHHRHVDKQGDPYGTDKGFWQSHLLWMFEDQGAIDMRLVKDLASDRLLVWQNRYYGWFMAGANLTAVAILWAVSGDLFGALVVGLLLRMFLAHHTTWFINSLAHMWGSKPYSSEHSAVNNFILAFLTYGEGYHNFHHTFAGDYRNGIRWWQFDPTKALIWSLNKLGLASDLKRSDPLMIKKRLLQEDQRLLIDHLRQLGHIDTTPYVKAVERLATRVSERINTAKMTFDRYRSLDRKAQSGQVAELKQRFRDLQRDLNRDLKEWKQLCNQVLSLQPATA